MTDSPDAALLTAIEEWRDVWREAGASTMKIQLLAALPRRPSGSSEKLRVCRR